MTIGPGSKCDSAADSASEDEREGPDQEEDSCCSEEDVYEGYVQESDLKGGRSHWEELEDEGVAKAESREVPLHVLRELKNVLTVRNSERDRRRVQRHGNTLSHDAALQSHDHQSTTATPSLSHAALQSHDPQSTRASPSLSHDHQSRQQEVSHDAAHSCDPTPSDPNSPPLGLPLDDHTPPHNPAALSIEMAAAIKNRKLKNIEDVFS